MSVTVRQAQEILNYAFEIKLPRGWVSGLFQIKGFLKKQPSGSSYKGT